MRQITDQEIVVKVLAGEDYHFRHLVRRYQKPLARLIYFHLRDANEVEDVTQETFIRAYHYLATYNQKLPLKNWLFAIAVNLCRSWRRKRIFTVPLKAVLPLAAKEDVAEDVMQSEGAREIKSLLLKLPPKESIVLILHYINSFTIKETAEILGIPAGTVKSRLNRGLRRLRNTVFKEQRERGFYEQKIDRSN